MAEKTNMQYEGLIDYAKTHTILECAEKYNCSYACMRSYIYKHKITYKQQSIRGENNPNYKHGGKNTRLFHIWQNMRDRCNREKNKQYKDYGARGIKVCTEWETSFVAFRNWSIKHGYDETLTIDRIDNDKGYCPDNCKWSNKYEQSNNKRTSRLLTYNGETKTLAQWCRLLALNYGTVASRLHRGKMSIDLLFSKADFNKNKKLYKELKLGKELIDSGVTDASVFKYFGDKNA